MITAAVGVSLLSSLLPLPSTRSRRSSVPTTLASCLVAAAVQVAVFFATPVVSAIYDGWPRGWLVHLVAVLAAFVGGLWCGLSAEAAGVTVIWWRGKYFTPMHPGLEVFAAIGVLQILIIDRLQRTHRALLQRQSELESARNHAEQARLAAQEANSVKDEFLATLSHELRTPLTVILGYCHMAASQRIGDDAGQSARVMAIIERNALAQLRIIEDLFEVQRLLRGETVLRYGAVDLRAAACGAVDALRTAADEKQVVVAAAIEPMTIAGDAGRIERVVWNLLSNAIKFSSDGGRVAVSIERAGEQAVLRVENGGDPIPAEFLPYVFEPFRQADMSTTRAHSGLGLGLAIVKGDVDLHGGSIAVTSDHDRTVFTVRLPVVRPSDGDRPRGGAIERAAVGRRGP